MRRVWAKDAAMLVKIGRELARQKTDITVTLPRALVTASVQAWDRDVDEEVDFDVKKETPTQRRIRRRAATLALIGSWAKLRRPNGGNKVKVRIDAWFIARALEAFYDDD